MKGLRHIEEPGWARLLVLGMLFLRGLVPAGFMLAPEDGRVAVVLCEARMSAGGHPYHHHHAGSGAHHDGAHGDPACPYALSAGPAPLPTLPAFEGTSTVGEPPVPEALRTFSRFGPTRQQTPRGPPPLA